MLVDSEKIIKNLLLMHEAYEGVKVERSGPIARQNCIVAQFVVTEVIGMILEEEGFCRGPQETKESFLGRYIKSKENLRCLSGAEDGS